VWTYLESGFIAVISRCQLLARSASVQVFRGADPFLNLLEAVRGLLLVADVISCATLYSQYRSS